MVPKRKAYSYIRMSTEIQLKGDSLRRQLEASKAYARENDLDLIDNICGVPLKDLGISAFKGKNAQTGALSTFINALEKGVVEPDSVLLIESLDRISRDKISSALTQFLGIVNSGIEIITLSDGQRYNKKRIDAEPTALLVSLMVMVRANEESELKSQRVREAWANKRKHSEKKILTKLCPGWLEYSEASGKFEVMPGRDEIVKLIFDMCINTGGLYAIAGHLNQRGAPTFGGGKIWYRSYIRKILSNRAVLGETQPHELVNGKRQKSGEPVLDYFPRLIDENTFLLAQAAVSRRTKVSRGRKGPTFGNLFMGMAYCGNCKSPMALRNHGGEQKYSKCLLCVNSRYKAGCDNGEWNVQDLEKLLFPHFREINFSSLLEETPSSNNTSIATQLEIAEHLLAANEKKMDEMVSSIDSLDVVFKVRERFSVKINALQEAINRSQAEIQELKKKAGDEQFIKNEGTQERLKDLLVKIDQQKEDYLFRSSVNQLLMRLVDRIELRQPKDEFNPWEFDEESPDVRKFRKISLAKTRLPLVEMVGSKEFVHFYKKQQRQVRVVYKSGAVRHILWREDASFGPAKNRSASAPKLDGVSK